MHPKEAQERPRLLLLNNDDPVRLQHPSVYVALRASIAFRLIEDPGQQGNWKISTAEYHYSLEDEAEQEYVAYHWHPEGRSDAIYPHLHIGRASQLPPRGVITSKLHLPTSRVAIEDVLRLAIQQLGVKRLHQDWAARLDESQAAFEAVQCRAQSSGKPAQPP